MIRIAICDDSSADACQLKQHCMNCSLYDNIEIAIFSSGFQLLEKYKFNQFDILFLDIDMPQMNGIETGKIIRSLDKNTIIIFSTSYPQYAIDAYDCEAFHYLLKPYSQKKLETILNRAVAKTRMLHKYHNIKIQNRVRRILLTDINYIEYCRKHIIYHTSKERIETTGKFSDVIYELQKFGFFQVHQGYIVNFEKVRDIKGYSIILNNDERVMISVRKKSEVLLAYAKYSEEFQ